MTKEEFCIDVKRLNHDLEKRYYYSKLVYNYKIADKKNIELFDNKTHTYYKVDTSQKVRSVGTQISISRGEYITLDFIFVDIDDLYSFYQLLERKKKIEKLKELIGNEHRKNLR
jgi:hypothetical protein